MEKIYCAYDTLNPAIDRTTGEEVHNCHKYNTIYCLRCPSRFDGDRIKRYMEEHPRKE